MGNCLAICSGARSSWWDAFTAVGTVAAAVVAALAVIVTLGLARGERRRQRIEFVRLFELGLLRDLGGLIAQARAEFLAAAKGGPFAMADLRPSPRPQAEIILRALPDDLLPIIRQSIFNPAAEEYDQALKTGQWASVEAMDELTSALRDRASPQE